MADINGLKKDFQRAIDICSALLNFAREKHEENEDREKEMDALRIHNMDLQSKSSRNKLRITKDESKD